LNWAGFVPPASSGTTSVTFAASSRNGPFQNIANPFQLNTLTFASGADAYTLSGNPLRFTGATSNLIQNAAFAMAIGNGILIDGNLVYSGTGSTTLTGIVSRSGVNDAANTSLTKTGTGTLSLDAANTFDGRVAIQQGQVRLRQGLALQDGTVALGVNDGLNLNGLSDVTLGNLSGTGSLALGVTRLSIGKNNQSPAAHSGTITGTTGSLTKVGSGTSTLSGGGSSFDNLRVQQGKLTLSGGSMTLTNTSQGLMVGTGVAGASGGPVLELIDGASVSAPACLPSERPCRSTGREGRGSTSSAPAAA
jgi:autotransporter-associated beta strand protein